MTDAAAASSYAAAKSAQKVKLEYGYFCRNYVELVVLSMVWLSKRFCD